MKKLKIGIVCYPSLGGSGVVATELGHALAAEGHEVHFITYEPPFRLKINNKNIFFHQVEINRYDLFRYPDYALPLAVKMVSISKKYGLDILHVHYAIPHATSAYLAKQILEKSGVPSPSVITTLHGTDITLVGRDPSYYEVVKYSIEQSDGVTAVSEDLRRQTIKYFDIKCPIEVIHNFFIPRRSLIGKKTLRSQFVNVIEGEKLLIHASNFRTVKRTEDVVRIFVEVRKVVKCKLLFVGTGVGIEDVRRMVNDLGLNEEVIFLGENREIDPYVASADVLLLPSSQESFGLVALEAMAYGIPVVASRVGGLPEVVIDGETGYLEKVGDIAAMTGRCVDLLTNESLYRKISEQASERAKVQFSASHVLPKYLAFYHRIHSALNPNF